MKHKIINISIRTILVFIMCLTSHYVVYAEIPTDDQLLELEQQIEQQEAAQKEAQKRATEEARRKAEKQKLKLERAKLEEERRKLEEERREVEAAKQAEIDRVRKEEAARQQAIEDQKRREEEAKQSIVTLVFYRNQSYPFNGDSAIISHNGKEIGKLASEAYFIYQTPPGEQTFKAVIFQDWTVERKFNFQPGSKNFMMTAIDWATVNITLEPVGVEVINGLKNSGQLNPRDFFGNFDDAMKNTNESKNSVKSYGF